MTQERINEVFETDLGQQLLELFTTPDDRIFIRYGEAIDHCRDVLNLGLDISKYPIKVWFPEN